MKKIALLCTAALTSVTTFAQQEVAKVVSVTPIMQQVSVPRQVCTTETVVTGQQKSGAGALMGGIAGGAMGNATGGGAGKAAATMIGIIGGAIIGDKIEGGGTPQTQNVQRCTTQNIIENRITSYSVVYEFGGKQYTVQMPNDPGPTIKLQLTPVSAAPASPDVAQVSTQPTYVIPATPVLAQAPVTTSYQVVAPAVAYDPAWYILPSIALGWSFGWHGGGGGWHHRGR